MKKIFILLFVGMFLICSGIFPQKPNGKNTNNTTGDPSYTYLNLNSISTVFRNNGLSDIDVLQSASGFKYPKETGKTAVYCTGLLWGAKIAGDPQVRVGGSAYGNGLQGGKILSPGIAEDPNDPHVRIYRVRPEVYPGGPPVDLSWEAFDEGKTEAEVRAQYEMDWTEWRAQDGAPYLDGNNNGQYDSDPASGDVPGISGAIQTIWFIANDLTDDTYNVAGTAPIGIEYQATMWEYKDSPWDNFFFRKYKLINKSYDTFDNMYVSMWSDPDIGDAKDDFVGCDTLTSLGYAYNAFDVDSVYLPLPPPAVGFDLIRGPLVPGNPGEDKNRNGVDDIYDLGLTEDNQRVNGFINLPMTAFYYWVREPWIGHSCSHHTAPPLECANEMYNYFQGKFGDTGEYFINPITGLPTTFALSGNPVTGEGWIDGLLQGPGDRCLGLSTGPIQMAPGDTQIVVIAEIAAGAIDGVTRMMAIDILKYYSKIAQFLYDNSVGVEDNIITLPNEFKLLQNYPNPFNPSTTISYSIPELSFVTLKVYDVLGSEIATLVNEEKPIGNYEVVFDASNYSNGIYFYRLQAGSFVETKKMVLMK
jgi:hypothetical protein